MQQNRPLHSGSLSCKKVIASLTFYADGELTSADALRLENHLEHCAACAVAWRNTQLAERALMESQLAIPTAGDLKAGFTARLIPAPRHSRTLPRFTLAPVGMIFVVGMAWFLWPRTTNPAHGAIPSPDAPTLQTAHRQSHHITQLAMLTPHSRRVSISTSKVRNVGRTHATSPVKVIQPLHARHLQLATNVPVLRTTMAKRSLPSIAVQHHGTLARHVAARLTQPDQFGGGLVIADAATEAPLHRMVPASSALTQSSGANSSSFQPRVKYMLPAVGHSGVKLMAMRSNGLLANSSVDIHVVDPTRHLNARLVLPASIKTQKFGELSSQVESTREAR